MADFTDAGATPGRKTTVTFDLPETVLIEPAWSEFRGPKQIHAASFDGIGDSYGVMQLASGWWGLEPINAEFFEQHEALSDAAAGVMGLGDFNTASGMMARPTHRKPVDLPGALDGSSPALVDQNDHFFDLLRPSGASSANGLVTALHAPPVPKSLRDLQSQEHVVLDRVAEATTPHDVDTGYLLRWQVPGNPFTKADWVLRFYFGGALTDNGLGAFCLLLGGNGTAVLYEREDDTSGAAAVVKWAKRETWRFANPQSTVNTVHQMRIIPHARRFIEFSSHLVDRAFSQHARTGAKLVPEPTDATKHLHVVTPANAAKRPAGQPWVTGSGPVRVDQRRDLAVMWQVARLVYRQGAGTDNPPPGLLIDFPMAIPWGVQAQSLGSEVPISFDAILNSRVVLPPGTPEGTSLLVSVDLFDGETRQPLVQAQGSATGHVQFLAPGGSNLLVPKIGIPSGDSYHSSYLWGYSVSRPKVTATAAPGAFTGGIVQSISVTGPDNDPTHETARIVLQDALNVMPRLATRSLLPVEIRTQYDGDPAKSAVVFRGYARSPRRRPMGREGMQYPAPGWAEYEIECIGTWRRLQASLITRFEDLAIDTDADPLPDGTLQKRKVTDVIRLLLGRAGLDDSDIDVPDLPMRLWFSPDSDPNETWRPAPGTRTLDYCQRLAFDYLGGYLLWDANAGTRGMWRLKQQPVAGTPLWQFLTSLAGVPVGGLAHSLKSYPAGVSPVLRVEGQMTLQTWAEPPEANAVLVTSTGVIYPQKGTALASRAWAINTKSVDVPAFGTHADPNSPDYMGWFEPVFDWPLGIQGFGDEKRIAAWMARRIFDFACRARPMASWTGHYVLVSDPSDPMLAPGAKRPLRFGDSILLDSDVYLVRAVNPEWEHSNGGDGVQLCTYQCQKWVPLTA